MTARIIDRGYRRFGGERRGGGHAVLVLWRHGVQRALGIRRPLWAKLIVAITAVLSFLPAIVFIGLTALLGDEDLRDLILPTYAEYYGFVTTAIVLFTAFVAPELLCTDRRSGMLGLYYASPLNRLTYLAARTAAIASVLAVVTIGPPLLLLIAYALQGAGPEGVLGFVETGLRIIAAGAVVTALMCGISMACASLTDRNAVATANTIMSILLSAIITGILVDELDGSPLIGLANLFALPFEIAGRIHGENTEFLAGDVSTVSVFVAAAVWIGLFALITIQRALRAEVRR